ncbi:hypothetical protein ACFW16_34120 [Inquilinus sp. NPDC058860]|uniref:hypothetical protein n=1 Tax=Inquilinus sp. NPDC058860 TaxID=3346652 RepID=UPI0036A25F85
MAWIRRSVLAAGLALALGAAGPQGAPAPTGDPVRTGKERLGDKASDEQRVDNCKVPPDRRGPKPRPNGCPHDGK